MAISNKYNHITNHTQLMHTIMHVNAAKVEQEEELKYQFKEIYYSLQPATLIKKAAQNVLNSPETKKNLVQAGVAIGTEFLISKFLKRSASIKGFLSSMIIEKIADYTLNGKSADAINNGIGKIGNLLKKIRL